MPELADVDGWRRYLSRYAKGRKIQRLETPDSDILRNTSPQGLGRALSGERFTEPTRHGKWLYAHTGGGATVLFHFGMTGELVWTSNPREPHAHDRVLFHLDGGRLAYRAQRKLGGVWLASDSDEAARITGPLGPDAYELSEDDFLKLLDERRGALKPALMDQELVAGIGNELSDEILFRARLRPTRKVGDVDVKERRRLHRAMQDVLSTSVRHRRIPRKRGWIESIRGSDDPRCPRCGGKVRKEKVGGRTSYWCPCCQD